MINKEKVGVLVPVYNEEDTVGEILSKLVSLKFIDEIVVVNDCSTDKSLAEIEKVKSSKIKVFSLKINSGKTAAIKKAAELSTADILIIQDADLEYDPDEIEQVIDPILQGRADVVYGSRFLVKKATRVLYFYHYLANKFLTFISNLFTNLNMSDIETCYKAFRSPILKNLPLTSTGFGMEVEITSMIAKLSIRVYEVPISYYGRTYEEGKKISMKDGLMAVYYIFYFNIFAPQQPIYRNYINKTKKDLGLT